jgi:hypothetical protein
MIPKSGCRFLEKIMPNEGPGRDTKGRIRSIACLLRPPHVAGELKQTRQPATWRTRARKSNSLTTRRVRRRPKIEGITEAQRRRGKGLTLIHDYHLAQMNEVRWIMEQVEAGEQSAATLVDAIFSMEMAANYRIFGNPCGRECHMLTLHHTIEDESIFPVSPRGQ